MNAPLKSNLKSVKLHQEILSGGKLRDVFHQSLSNTHSHLLKIFPSKPSDSAIDLIDSLRDLQVNTNAQSSDSQNRECGAGCSACCFTVAVDVTAIEALACAEYLTSCVGLEEVNVIKNRLNKLTQRRRLMSDEQRRKTKLRCGLLDEQGLCQVYPVRPLICAGVFSLDQSACNEAASAVGEEEKCIPLDRPAKVGTMGISAALQQALVKKKLDGNLYELNSAVLCGLETENAMERFLQGEDIFRDAICTDAHSYPRKKKQVKLKRISPVRVKNRKRSA
ncbi:MAG: YkgJ family cysteine cluster protein [Pirellulales bacterium]